MNQSTATVCEYANSTTCLSATQCHHGNFWSPA